MVSSQSRRFVLGACATLAACTWAQDGLAQAFTQNLARCEDLLPPATPVPAPPSERTVAPEDLARLRQIGQPQFDFSTRSALAVSPDGRTIAFTLERPDPARNTHCLGLAVLNLDAKASPRLIDRGGEIQLTHISNRGSMWNIGSHALVAPLWSSDGGSIAYLRRDSGVTQAWIADVATGSARQVTHETVDVEQIAWLPGDRGLVFASRTARLEAAERLSKEALSGYRYDDRWVPSMANMPLPDGAIPLTYYTLDTAGKVELAGAGDAARLSPDPLTSVRVTPEARSAAGEVATLDAPHDEPGGSARVVARRADGSEVVCTAGECGGRIVNLWWFDGAVVFLRREGWANGTMALYRWHPGAGAPRRLLATSGLVRDCAQAGANLVCLMETATRPVRIVGVNPRNGAVLSLHDPNPEFDRIRFGRVQRLEWRNDVGLEVRGDLVLPPDYMPGRKLPLIVTTYTSDGFLRGGFGDEYPIQAFAAKGFAVLSYQRPRSLLLEGHNTGVGSPEVAALTKSWTERRSIQSAIEEGVRRVVAMGIADPARVGITGLSDGSSTAEFALVNSRTFAAAAVSTCCVEPWTIDTAAGPTFAAGMRATGWPATWTNDREFWANGSIAQNAARIDTPLLIQQAQSEYLYALGTFAALRENGKPVDLYVFPGEYHHKWQPAHRLAIYSRNLDWFRFWLQDVVDPDPVKAAQYERWRELKANWRKAS